MKRFGNYQHVDGEPMNARDEQEVGSKFWNKGKWDNFVLPFISDDCNDMTLVDMGCNAGVFLKLAEDKGFKKVIGIDANGESLKKAIAYKERNGGKYEIQRRHIERTIDHLPVADYTVLANTHYYFKINDWLDYLDKLQVKTRYCIIVTAEKRERLYNASADTKDIKEYFKNWDYVGIIDDISQDDPFPRNQWSLCFKSRFIDRVPTEGLIHDNTLQVNFYKELEEGIDPLKTEYYNDLKNYRNGSWTDEKLARFIIEKANIFKDVRDSGLKKPIIINSDNKILDGIHRYEMMKYLGHKSVLVRIT